MNEPATRVARGWAIALLITTALLAGTGAARASHLFSDVPTSAIYHDAASWLATRAVTLGCATGLFCPDDFVTRAQMALFMNRLGKALSPTFLIAEAVPGAQDIDASPILCQTTDYTPTFPQRAKADGWIALDPAGVMNVSVRLVYSTNAGASWFLVATLQNLAGATATDEWFSLYHTGVVDLTAGTPYRFGIQIGRVLGGGTADATNSRCSVFVQLTNRNPDGVLPDGMVRQPSRAR